MKVGITTFQWSYNCGSILQCMALRDTIASRGHEVDVINYSSPAQRRLYSVFYPWSGARNIAKNILCAPGRKTIADHYAQYLTYIISQFGYADEPMSSSEALSEKLPRYDALIAGGDQVWNVNCDDFSTVYFLDFDDTAYKFSYSPSLGATDINTSPEAKRYAQLLSRFAELSCREPNGQRRLEQLTGRGVTLALDPTLLLTADDWRARATGQIPFTPNGYIFYYAFSYSKANNTRIQEIAEELDLPVVVIDAKQWYIKRMSRYKNFVLSRETGPNAFLKLTDGAKYVVTTSFHGTAFATLYRKQFCYINIPTHDSGDDRTSFLVERLGLTDRFIPVEDLTIDLLDRSINYDEVLYRLETLKTSSLEYLDRNLESAEHA